MLFSTSSFKFLITLFFLLILFFLSCKEAPSEAPEIITKITGKVTDKETNQPISGAQITTNPSTSSVNTGTDGNYTIPDLTPGQYTVTAKKEAYNDNITTVTVQEGKTVAADIQLNKLSPELEVTPNILDFETSKTSLSFFITNKLKVGTVTWKITTDQSWLSISPIEGTTSSETDPIQVTVDRNNISAGNFSATIVVTSDAGSANVNVLMTKLNPSAPQITITPDAIDFGESLVSSQVEIKNTGTGLLTWSASINGSWISISNNNGTIQAGNSVIGTITINKNGLSPNNYNGSILFNSDGGNESLNIKMVVPQGTINPPTLQLNGATTSSSISLGWTRITDSQFSSYKLFRSLTPGVNENSVLVTTLTNSNDNFYTDNNLQSGTTYFYSVFVHSNNGIASGSNEISATTQKTLSQWVANALIPGVSYSYLTPNSLFAIDENEAWFVFNKEIWKFNGSSWNKSFTLPSSQSGTFQAVYGIDVQNVWAVGTSGIFYKYNGISWTAITNSVIGSSTLYDIVASSPDNIWVSSSYSKLFHFQDNEWTSYTLISFSYPLRFDLLSEDAIWAIDKNGRLFRYGGVVWTPVENSDINYPFMNIQAVSDSDVWVSYQDSDESGLWHFDGTSFLSDYKLSAGSTKHKGRKTVEMISSNEGWSAFSTGNKLSHFDGNEWIEVNTPVTSTIYSIKMLNSNSGWAVGAGGEILRYKK